MIQDKNYGFVDVFENTSRENSKFCYEYFMLLPIFEEIKFHLFPTYKYKLGNCHCVAHFAGMVLNAYQVKHEKVWIFAPCKYDLNSKEVIQIEDKNKISPKGVVRWGYHVANVVIEGGKKWIFDFSLNENAPLLLDEWLSILNVSRFHLEFQDWQHYLFYTNEIKNRRGFMQSFYNGNYFPYQQKCKENLWLEKGLAINQTAYQFLIDEFWCIEDNTLMDDYKKLVGSINNFECVLKSQTFNKNMTMGFQEKHKEIIESYRKIYQANLEKWQTKVEVFI